MAWNVNDTYNFMKWLVRKNQTGLISATDFFYAWNSEQTTVQTDLIGNWHKINNTKQGINTGLIQNAVIMTALSPFVLNDTISITSGIGLKPANLIYTLALRINGKQVFEVNHDQIAAVNDDVIDTPSITENAYYYSEYNSGGQLAYSFLPNTVTEFELDYIVGCTDVVWGYSLDGNQRQVYNSGSSTQPQWLQPQIVEITKRTLKALGVSFKDGDFEQYGQSITQTGD